MSLERGFSCLHLYTITLCFSCVSFVHCHLPPPHTPLCRCCHIVHVYGQQNQAREANFSKTAQIVLGGIVPKTGSTAVLFQFCKVLFKLFMWLSKGVVFIFLSLLCTCVLVSPLSSKSKSASSPLLHLSGTPPYAHRFHIG